MSVAGLVTAATVPAIEASLRARSAMLAEGCVVVACRIRARAVRAGGPSRGMTARTWGQMRNDSRAAGIRPATIKNGTATANRLSSIHAKKRLQTALGGGFCAATLPPAGGATVRR